jgi:hypothetical protein
VTGEDDPQAGDAVLVWNGALSTVRVRVPCADARTASTARQAEAAEPLRPRAPQAGARRSPGGTADHDLAPVAPHPA